MNRNRHFDRRMKRRSRSIPILNQLFRNNKIHLITSFVFFTIYFLVFYYEIRISNWSERTTRSKLSFIMKCTIGLGFPEVFRYHLSGTSNDYCIRFYALIKYIIKYRFVVYYSVQ